MGEVRLQSWRRLRKGLVHALPRLAARPWLSVSHPRLPIPICVRRRLVSVVPPDRNGQELGLLRLQNPLARGPFAGDLFPPEVGVGKSLTSSPWGGWSLSGWMAA